LRISQRSIEEVREAADILEVTSEFTALKRQGARFAGLCPYPDHQEKTPSFSVSPDRGFYYCFGCLEANERIWTSRGLIPIAEAEPGDEVIGIDGRREAITDKWFKSGPTLRIKTGAAEEGIELTPDHRCVFVKREEALRAMPRVHLRQSGGKKLRFSSRHNAKNANVRPCVDHASEVREGDFWLYPVVSDEERKDSLLPGQHLIREYNKGPRNARITELPVNPRTAWLYGIWLAEGSLYRGDVKWSFGFSEAESLAAKVVETLEEGFGRSSTSFLRPHKNICEVTCSSTDLSTLFNYWFGRGGADKRVPAQALSWTAECQDALVRGYLDGAGHARNGVISAASVSEALTYGIFALCIQTGKVCSTSTIPGQTGKDGVRHRKAHYYIHVLSKESLRGFFAEINGTNYFWSIVQEVKPASDKPTTVVDIATTGSHTFLTKLGVTHNCQRGGDAIKLVMDLKSFDFTEAVSYLAERSGVDLQFEGGGDPDATRQRSVRRRAIHKALAAAAVYYHKFLLNSQTPEAQQARRYLKNRQIERSTIEEFRLGYAPPRGASRFLAATRKLDIDTGTLDAAGLLSSRGGERFAGRITFPISDRRGRIVGFGARAMGDAQPKYLNSPETETFNKRDLLYGFPQVSEAMRRERAALVVEGYTDVLMLYQFGIKNAVATLGTATTPGHLRTLSSYADTIYVLFDPDAAGEKAIERAAATAADLKLDLRVLRLPEDPADWLLEHPPEEFTELLSSAVPVLEYGIRRIVARTRGAGATERSRAVPEIRGMIAEIKDPVLYREALRLATESLGVAPEVLRKQEPANARAESPRARGPADPHTEAGGAVLTLLLNRPDLTAPLLREGLQSPALQRPLVLRDEDFRDETQAKIFTLLREHAGGDLDAVFSVERARPLMDEIGALASQGERLFPTESYVREAWLRLAILSRERSKRETQDYDRKEMLQAEIRQLKQALRSVSAGA
jgi:DNA primase